MTAGTDFRRWLRRYSVNSVFSGFAAGIATGVLVGTIVGVDSVTGIFLFWTVGVCAGIAFSSYLAIRRKAPRDEPTQGDG